MSIRVDVFHHPDSGRSRDIGRAIEQGIKRSGVKDVRFRHMFEYRNPEADAAIFYGLMRPIMDGYKKAGRPFIFIDLGYWGRVEGGRREGYHKLVLNSRHPTEYFQRIQHDSSRFEHFKIDVKPWRGGKTKGYILLVGMSAKAAAAQGFRPEEWERHMVKEIRKHTNREIIYRPKPSWHHATRLIGTRMQTGEDGDIERTHFDRCHAIVTHHSNVAIEGILNGIPVFCWDGVAMAPGKASSDLALLEQPPEAVGREQWAWDIAWTQWNVSEMRSGAAWRYLEDEGLVPR